MGMAEDNAASVAAGQRLPPVLGMVGWSGSGKTTLLEQLLPVLRARGVSVSVIKHSHHDIVLDVPGKDSDRHRRAGAQEVMVVSPQRWGLFAETTEMPTLEQQLQRLAPVDLVLVEGQKQLAIPKIEIVRSAVGALPRYPADCHIIAVASDAAPAAEGVPPGIAWLDLNDVPGVADFLQQWLQRQQQK